MFDSFKTENFPEDLFIDTRGITKLGIINQWCPISPILIKSKITHSLPSELIPFAVKKGSLGTTMSALFNWGILHLLEEEVAKNTDISIKYTEILNIGMKGELEKLFSDFRDEGLEVVLLKGHDMINSYYLDYRIRPTTDADILIRRGDLNKIEEILKARGYKTKTIGASSIWGKGSFLIDIHFEITDEERISARRYLPKITADEIFDGARTEHIGESPYLSPDPYHSIIITSMHALKHSYLMDYWFMDTGKIILSLGDSFSTERLFASAGTKGVRYPVSLMLWALNEFFLFPIDLPGDIRPSFYTRRLIYAATRSTDFLHFGEMLFGLHIDSYQKRLYYYKEFFYPKSKILKSEIGIDHSGDIGRLKLYLLRTFHLFRSLFAIIFRKGV